MSTLISAGATQSVTLPKGYKIDITGSGVAVLGPGDQKGAQFRIINSGSVGPFDRQQIVALSAGAGGMSYATEPPADSGPAVTVSSPMDTPGPTQLSLEQIAATKSLVSGAGIPASITYDTAGRVATVTNASGTVYTYAYSATTGLLSTITGGGVTQTFNYGADGTLSSVVNS